MTASSPYWPPFTLTDDDGHVVVDRLAINFFLEPRACLDPLPVMKAITQFLRTFLHAATHYYTDDEGDALLLGDPPEPILQKRIATPTLQRSMAEFSLVELDASPYREYVSYFFDVEELGNLRPEARIPLRFRIDQAELVRVGPQVVTDFVLSLSHILPYSYAYAHPSLTCEYSFPPVLPCIRRHPGLDVAIASSVAHDLGDGPLGAYWINLFGPGFCKQLGTTDDMVSRLPAEAVVLPCGRGGLCVRLGDAPDIGDVNGSGDLFSYRQLAAILRDWLRVPRVTYFTDSEDIADRDAQAAWHHRFLSP